MMPSVTIILLRECDHKQTTRLAVGRWVAALAYCIVCCVCMGMYRNCDEVGALCGHVQYFYVLQKQFKTTFLVELNEFELFQDLLKSI
mgnify:CR=1 FL=1